MTIEHDIQQREALLKGVVDLHIHTMPDVRQRRLSDIELAQEAARVGARAVVIKSHLVPTAGRAYIAEKVVPGVRVFGGITLNPPVGGLNPAAVETAIRMGAKIVWLPTAWSSHERKLAGKNDGVESVINGKVVPALVSILELIARHDVALATGHLSPAEILTVVDKAKTIGVRKIIVNHPEWWSINLPISDQKRLVPYGVFFERCYATRQPGKDYEKNFAKNLQAIESVGCETTILATDGGQTENPVWSEAYSEYIAYLLSAGISTEIMDKMTKTYPAQMLGLD